MKHECLQKYIFYNVKKKITLYSERKAWLNGHREDKKEKDIRKSQQEA